MNISAWSIRNPVPAVLLFALLSVLGLLSFQRLQVQDFPDMDLPAVTVTASLEGAAPAQLETEVARKIEDALASIDRLDQINTTISDGLVLLRVNFELEKDIAEAQSEVRNAIDRVRAELPAGMNPPTVAKVTASGAPLLTYTVASQRMDEQDLSWFVDNELSKALLALPGVASVTRIGGVDREVQVDLNPSLMAGLGVTPADVSARLRAVQKEASGGEGRIGGQRQSSRMLATVATADEIGALTIPLADGRYVRLDQIARIADTHAERSSMAFHNGEPVVGFQVTRSRGHSDPAVAHGVREALQALRSAYPHVHLQEVSTLADAVEEDYRDSMALLYEGAILAVIVVWWFLRDWRATLISATALPLSILPTFLFLDLVGFTLNMVTLLSLSLVVGILVDDAIVEVENIERHLRMGKTPYQAAMEAADEIGLAVVATTLTLVAVFLPTAFMSGVSGKVFRQFGLTASVAVLASLLVARVLTPMMAAYLLKPAREHTAEPATDGALMSRYLRWVRTALQQRRHTVLAAGLFFLLSMAALPLLPKSFMPPKDQAQTQVRIQLPPGSSLEDTAALSAEAARRIAALPEIRSVFAAVGSTSSSEPGERSRAEPTSAVFTVDLVPAEARELNQSAVEAKMREVLRTLPGARITVQGPSFSSQSLPLTLASDDPHALAHAAAQVEAALRTLPGLGAIVSSAALQRPEIQIRPDNARAAALGVTSEALAETVRLATYGDYALALPKLNLPERQIPIRVRMDPQVRDDLDAIGQLRVPSHAGSVSLASVAELSLGSGPTQIDRLDRSRNVTLSIELNGQPLGSVTAAALALPALQQLPGGVRLIEQGDSKHMRELFESFGLAMGIGVFCIYAVLVLLFHDFLQPATILCALPLALGGALGALWITGQSFSMPVVIGLLMLMGIVTKNSILLVEYAILARRDHGLPRLAAVIDACHKRARPIVMTTIAMGAGMLPNALGLGAEPSFRQPMAIVVIGGLLTSTVLSLLVIPVVFTYVDDLLLWLRRVVLRRPAASVDTAELPAPADAQS